jgi:hypothetical protein
MCLIFSMLKIKFSGFFNSNLKMTKKKQGYYNNTTNIFFFYFFLKTILFEITKTFSSRITFLRKKNFNFFFIKYNIRYKISKHVLQKISNRFIIQFSFNLLNNNIIFFFKKFNILSATYLNINFLKVFTKINNLKFLSI